MLIFGVLPQVVKIYCCRGVPWTQSWCAAYLLSFLVDENLASLSPSDSGVTAGQETPISNVAELRIASYTIYMRTVVWVGFTLACGFFTHGLYQLALLTLPGLLLPQLIGFIILLAVWICLLLTPHREDIVAFWTLLTTPTTMSLTILSSVFLPIMMVTSTYTALETQWRKRVGLGIVCVAAVAATIVSCDRLLKVIAPRRQKYLYFVLGTYFLLTHLFGAVLYYGLVYDPTTTYKPWWTTYLG